MEPVEGVVNWRAVSGVGRTTGWLNWISTVAQPAPQGLELRVGGSLGVDDGNGLDDGDALRALAGVGEEDQLGGSVDGGDLVVDEVGSGGLLGNDGGNDGVQGEEGGDIDRALGGLDVDADGASVGGGVGEGAVPEGDRAVGGVGVGYAVRERGGDVLWRVISVFTLTALFQ